MNTDEVRAASAAAYYILLAGQYLKSKRRRKRRYWMTSLYKSRRRRNAADLLGDLLKDPSGNIGNFCRMSSADFEDLLGRIAPAVTKSDTNMREAIPVQERLAVTLRFLASGDSYSSLSNLCRFSKQTISRCVTHVCRALIDSLKDEIKLPETEEEWLEIAHDFERQWNFPNCVGALDGKQIVMQCLQNTVILLALVNANYCFTFVSVGRQGRASDGNLFNDCPLYSKLQEEELHLPADARLPSSNIIAPYVVLGGPGLPLSKRIMTPYLGADISSKERIYNHRLCRARRVADDAFGLVASVFRVFRKPMLLEPETVNVITLTCVMLHNYMRKSSTSAELYSPPGTFDVEVDGEVVPGSWRNDQDDMKSFFGLTKRAREPAKVVKRIQDSYAEYFSSSDRLSGQHEIC